MLMLAVLLPLELVWISRLTIGKTESTELLDGV